MIEARTAQQTDIDHIAENMRQADRVELWAASRRSPRRALEFSLRNSESVWTGTADGLPFVMFGVGERSRLMGVGVPWLLGTDLIEKHAVHFLRQSVAWKSTMLQNYRLLTNHVDDRNAVSIRWLRWLGFQMSDPVPYGPDQLPFRQFELRRENV